MKLTTCEGDQLIEATRLWFAKSGGVIKIKIKKVKLVHDQDESVYFIPKDFENSYTNKDRMKVYMEIMLYARSKK